MEKLVKKNFINYLRKLLKYDNLSIENFIILFYFLIFLNNLIINVKITYIFLLQ